MASLLSNIGYLVKSFQKPKVTPKVTTAKKVSVPGVTSNNFSSGLGNTYNKVAAISNAAKSSTPVAKTVGTTSVSTPKKTTSSSSSNKSSSSSKKSSNISYSSPVINSLTSQSSPFYSSSGIGSNYDTASNLLDKARSYSVAGSLDTGNIVTPDTRMDTLNNIGADPTGGAGGGAGGAYGSDGSVGGLEGILGGVNAQYDKAGSLLSEQLANAGIDYQEQMNMSDAQKAQFAEQLRTGIAGAEQASQEGMGAALSNAKQTELRNRNTLRALGILGSSAAGDILSRGWNQYDKSVADIANNLVQRKQALESDYNGKINELSNQARILKQRYSQVVNSIQRDLAYNEQERASAIAQANIAYQQMVRGLTQQADQITADKETTQQQLDDLANGLFGPAQDNGSRNIFGITINPSQ